MLVSPVAVEIVAESVIVLGVLLKLCIARVSIFTICNNNNNNGVK